MSETVNETPAVTFKPGDRVKVSTEALDGSDSPTVPIRVLGEVGILDFLDNYSGWYVRPVNGERGAYVGAKYITPYGEADELREQIATLTKQVADLTVARDTQATALQAFKATVRTTLVNKAESVYSDEAEQFDELLSDLDLEGRLRDFELRVDFEGSFYPTVEATSLAAAIAEAEKFDYVREYLRDNVDGDWLDSVSADEQ